MKGPTLIVWCNICVISQLKYLIRHHNVNHLSQNYGNLACLDNIRVLLREKSLFDIVVIKPKTLTTVFPSARWKVYIEKNIT